MRQIQTVIKEMKTEQIMSIIDKVDLRNPASISEARSRLLAEDTWVKRGDTVAIIDDANYDFGGLTAKVTSDLLPGGFVNVELNNGTVIPMQANMLLLVKK